MFKRKKNTEPKTESEWIALAKVDRAHFGFLYEKYFDVIFRFVFKRLGGDEEKSGDITQHTFLKAMSNLHAYEDRGFPFSAWLYRIAQNEINQLFRSEKKTRTVDLNENQLNELLVETEIDVENREEVYEKLTVLLNDLSAEHQELIEIRFFQGLSFKEIAEIYQITEANAKMKIYRILEKLNTNWKLKS